MMSYEYNIWQRFDEIASHQPNHVALVYASGEKTTEVTYGELKADAITVAQAIFHRGIVRGDVVAILNDKGRLGFAAILACLRLGVTYTHLDPDSPLERVRRIVTTCKPRLLICTMPESAVSWNILESGIPEQLSLEKAPDVEAQESSMPPVADISGSTAAYIMFTSGSTGMPKGAVMSHANLINLVDWAADRFLITSEDTLTNVNPIYFDNSVFDLYASLFNGAKLAPFRADQTKDPQNLVRLVSQVGCTIWFSVPSLLVYLLTTRSVAKDSLSAIRAFIFGGEGFPKTKLRQLHELVGHHAVLENVYGPTECTCICSARTVSTADLASDDNLAPLGYLNPNFEGIVDPVDDLGDGNTGELLLGGPCVGMGYYNDPGRTNQSFVQNPHHSNYRDIYYRTGDLVRRDEMGQLHFLGRTDFQIKHLGYRIELEEIEAAFNHHVGVDESAAIYQVLGQGLGQIVAFVTGSNLEVESLADGVRARLPHYMLPRRIVIIDGHLPKNANGKIDRHQLKGIASKN